MGSVYQVVCRHSATRVNSIENDGTVTADVATVNGGESSWVESLNLNGYDEVFKIDTGADVTVISMSTFDKLKGITLQQPTKKLCGLGRSPLSVVGQFTGTICYKMKSVHIFVVDGLQKSLVGRPAIQGLDFVVRIDSVGRTKEDEAIVLSHPKLFSGLGEFSGEYTIRLRENAKPFALTTPRRVALPLIGKVRKELERMQLLGVIRKVDEPTRWCAGMVVVPKLDGNVRICVDLGKLNKNVCREGHISPSVDHSLVQLSGARIFYELDANSGFWQVKLPFGITSAPEYIQKRMSQVLDGLEGVICSLDDVLVYGATQTEHNTNLEAVFMRIEEAGITLNREKCSFSQNSIKFLHHIIETSGIRPDPDKIKAIQNMPEPNNVPELRRFLGMVNQMSKFTP